MGHGLGACCRLAHAKEQAPMSKHDTIYDSVARKVNKLPGFAVKAAMRSFMAMGARFWTEDNTPLLTPDAIMQAANHAPRLKAKVPTQGYQWYITATKQYIPMDAADYPPKSS